MNILPGNMRFGAGQPVKRLEDQRLLTGKGQFIDDKPEEGALWLHVLRSPHAHAKIVSIDAKAASEMPGVEAVYTGADLVADNIGTIPTLAIFKRQDGKPMTATPRGPLRWEDSGRKGLALHLDGKPVEIGTDVGGFDKDGARSFGCWIHLPKTYTGSASILARMDDDDGFRGWDLSAQDSEFTSHLVHHWQDDAIKVVTTGKAMKPGTWQHVFVTYDGSGKGEGFIGSHTAGRWSRTTSVPPPAA
jgi:hypothetical protein